MTIEYRNVDTMTLAGIEESEKLTSEGWTRYDSTIFRDRYYRKVDATYSANHKGPENEKIN